MHEQCCLDIVLFLLTWSVVVVAVEKCMSSVVWTWSVVVVDVECCC